MRSRSIPLKLLLARSYTRTSIITMESINQLGEEEKRREKQPPASPIFTSKHRSIDQY